MYLVVFRNRKRSGTDHAAYDAQADAMESLAAMQPGFRSYKSYIADDGEVAAISEWESEADARAWGGVAEHLMAQADGRRRWYAEYTLFGCNEPRIHRFEAKD